MPVHLRLGEMTIGPDPPWHEVLVFWFPESRSLAADAEIHRRHWGWRMHGAADGEIAVRFADLTEGVESGHYAALSPPWFRIAFTQPLGHTEGPGHLERVDQLIRLREDVAATAPAQLQPIHTGLVAQAGKVREVIAAFGRHPHRNEILGRPSTEAEAAYIARGDFPHENAFKG